MCGILEFSDFAKKVANVPKLTKFIYFEYHLSQFSAKLKKKDSPSVTQSVTQSVTLSDT